VYHLISISRTDRIIISYIHVNFMDPHILELPRRVVVGKGVIDKIGKDYGILRLGERPLILVDDSTLEIAGNRVTASLSRWNPKVEKARDSTDKEAERVSGLAGGCSCIIAVGGGTIIDIAKVASFRKGLAFISVPTAPSHDGIASERASIIEADGRTSVRARPPLAIVADIDILSNAPYRLIAAGAADAISNLTAVRDWKLGHEKGEYYSKYAASIALFSGEIVIASANQIRNKEERGIRNLIEALLTSSIAMSIAGSSRPASGAEHAFSHALDSLGSQALHGEQCGIGSILMACHQGGDWERIRLALQEIGAPTTAKQIGISSDTLTEALLKANQIRSRFSILDERPLDRPKALDLARKTGVI
jgi:glycerol-1-phosphate dehydrogenase [NAD(P)+]